MQVVELQNVLDMVAAPALKDCFLQNEGNPLLINAAPVQRLGAQCLQILLSAKKDWEAKGVEFVLDSPSAAFIETAKFMGVAVEDLTYQAQVMS